VFRWGIIGAGYVARKFVLGLRKSDGGTATLVCSRTEATVRAFARDFGIATVRSSVEDAARSSDVDAFKTPRRCSSSATRNHSLPGASPMVSALALRRIDFGLHAADRRGVLCESPTTAASGPRIA
jgi:pyrroline-5-carboxylate reductase